MAKPLRDVAPKENKLSGVKKSKTEPADISKWNGASGNQDFAKKHTIQKYDDRVGNDHDAAYGSGTVKFEGGRKSKHHDQVDSVYEAYKCNMTEAGTMCEVHGDKDCSTSGKVPEAGVGKRGMIADKKKLDEVLTKKTSKIKVIDDFVKSDNKMFSGDSKKQRIKRALGAYYKLHSEDAEQIDEISDKLALSTAKGAAKSMDTADVNTDKGFSTFQKRAKTQALALDKMNPDYKRLKAKVGTSEANAKDAAYKDAVKEDLAMPMLEGGKKKKTQKESAPGDTPMRFPSGNVGDSDTGRV